MYSIKELIRCLTPIQAVLNDEGALIIDLAYDTRKIYNGGQSLFFALINQRDGHLYMEEAYAKGVRSFVVSSLDIDEKTFPESNIVWVEDTLRAMQEIAIFHRNHFAYPIIGITGSNGKTIVKEWLFQLLSADYTCFQSPKSYNSQLGVALSLWQLSADYDLAILEAGISQEHEMQQLADMIQPTIGVFTSLGTAHREGFASKEIKLMEKWKLFQNAQTIVAPSSAIADYIADDPRIISWGFLSNNFVYIKNINNSDTETYVKVVVSDHTCTLTIPFTDQASIENTLTCATVLFYLGINPAMINQRISQLKPLEMRLKLKRGKNNASIIDDSYSNDVASLQIALDFLNQQNQFDSKKLILSDFDGEEWTEKLENKIIDLIHHVPVDQLFLVGANFKRLQNKISNANYYTSTAELLQDLPQRNLANATILVKGARKYQLEKVTAALVEQSHETVLEINLKSIEHNIQQYRSKLSPGVKVMAMVKAFSYGSGSFEVANILQFNKIDYLTVAFVDEGVALRKGGITLPIMVLSPHESTFEDLVSYQLEPELYSFRILESFTLFLKNRGLRDYPVHIKLDTGMHRLGFMEQEVDVLIENLQEASEIKVASVFSHLVGAGDPDLVAFTKQQIKQFSILSERIRQALKYQVLRHICNTSGILHHPEAHFDMVRLGIGLYGFDMAPRNIQLEHVSQLKTTITQIKRLPKTETVGYDRKGKLHKDSTIATVKIGYADGYNRRFGNGVGKMEIAGFLAPTIGNICMDMCMLDITDMEGIKEGDEVVVFPDVALAAREIGTIPYELLTSISSRVKRVYFYE